MTKSTEHEAIANFLKINKNMKLFSTSAKVVQVHSNVYNVRGSTLDPKIGGKSWKQLLISYGINGNCYVDNAKPPSGKVTSHNAFSVGGHMTDKSNGIVSVGDESYLMPLCYWHNSTKRDGVAFQHSHTDMLLLDGFMQGDTAITFMARLSDEDEKLDRIIFETEDGWDYNATSTMERISLAGVENFKLYDTPDEVSFFTLKKETGTDQFVIDHVSDDLKSYID